MKRQVVGGACADAPLDLFITETTLERMRGLLGRRPLQMGQAMVLAACNAVHTFGMAYAIDIVFADRAGVIRKICHAVPRRRLRACIAARYVVELPGGEATRQAWAVGQPLPFLCEGLSS